jgi:MoaA/NifB/PqqE/SkfB family radical SAM enzyme
MSSSDLSEMPFLRNIGLIVTYKCQVACPHCIIEAGPHRKEEMALNDALNWIQQAAYYRNGYIKVLSLTGGEPFYNADNLKQLVIHGEKYGLIVSVVTNAFWATTAKEALRILREFSAIKMLAISTDEYHQQAIPFERVKNAIFAAKECGIPYNIHVCTENDNNEEYKTIIEKLLELTEMDTINTAVTFPAGRALKTIGILKHEISEEPPISACAAGSSPIIFPDGRIIACIGPVIDLQSSHPLVLGNLRENSLHEILDKAELNPILHTVRVWGPKKLISIIKEARLTQYLPKGYIKDSVCNACYHLMSSDKLVDFLFQLATDSEFQQKVAYARMYYLNETKMVELYQLTPSSKTQSNYGEHSL